MNDCMDGEVRDALPDLVHGTLSGDAKVRVEQHVAVCAECAAEVELLRTARAALRFAPAMDVNRIASAVRSAGAERIVARRAWRSPARLIAMAVAAGIVAVALASREGPRSQITVDARPIANAGNDAEALPTPAPARATAPEPAIVLPVAARAAPSSDERSLALGTDLGDLGEDQLVALLESVSELDVLPSEDPMSVEVEAINVESQS